MSVLIAASRCVRSWAKLVEEVMERRLVASLAHPDHARRRAGIGDHGDVAVPPSPALLIDVDRAQPVEPVAAPVPRDPTIQDPADGSPADADEQGDRGLVSALGEPGDQILEGIRVPGARWCERDGFGDHAVARAAQPPQRHAQDAAAAGKVEVAPRARRSAVVQRTRAEATVRTAQAPPPQADVDDQELATELDSDDAHGRDGEDATEYRGGSHPDLLDRLSA